MSDLDYPQKEELFNIVSSEFLKDYIGNDALLYVNDTVRAILETPYDYIPENAIKKLAKAEGVS